MIRPVVVANPGTPRWRSWEAARQETGVQCELIAWSELFDADERGRLADHAALQAPRAVRFDSFGKDESIGRRLLARGAAAHPERFDAGNATRPYAFGELHPPGQFSTGVKGWLNRLGAALQRGGATPWISPLAVAAMLDKGHTRLRLRAAGIPIPDGLDDVPASTSVDQRLRIARDRGFQSLYIKQRSGSSACGLVWLRLPARAPITGLTTIALVKGRFLNTRRLRSMPWPALAPLVAFLHQEGATWEAGIPLLRVAGAPCDVRMVVHQSEVVAIVGRSAPHPITNLHLGGCRLPEDRVRSRVSARCWSDARAAAVRAVQALDAHSGGVDIAFDDATGRPFVLEVNAFGDFFPHWRDATGRSLHGAVLEALSESSR